MPSSKPNPLQVMHEAKSDLERDAIHRKPVEASAENAVTKLLALRDAIKAEKEASPYVKDLGRVLDGWATRMKAQPPPSPAPPDEEPD